MPKGGRNEHEDERDREEHSELARIAREEKRADEELERYRAQVAPRTLAGWPAYVPERVHEDKAMPFGEDVFVAASKEAWKHATAQLPTDALQRKDIPIFSGVLRYFPLALAAVAQCSKVGNDQHNPGEPLHWAREKSTDEGDALVRHQLEVGTRDTDGIRHATKVAWRALAQLQKEIEADGGEL